MKSVTVDKDAENHEKFRLHTGLTTSSSRVYDATASSAPVAARADDAVSY